ncbi:SPOR domain-containing protein [Vibrio sp. NTOU-M3]|uniref:SPOR domain-containing protein n=1 Tax=Vibrio sp. NTOU-M3 TaxID=3234954 RepID=UPI00349F50EC
MSLTHASHVLDLESQTELLERLQLLTNFGSNLITVGGANGAGKSWLAQRYLEVWAEDKNQSLLMCHPNQDDDQRRSTILTQLVSDPLFNPADSLVDSFSRLFDGVSCDIAIVVDDGHLLSETFISELWMLVLEAQTNPAWSINVVLFAQASSLGPLLTRLGYGQEHKPIDLEIDALSKEEADRFFEQLVMRYIEDDMEKRIRHAYRKVNRLPGEIMALSEHKPEKRIIIRSIVGSPMNILLVILVLLLLIGGGYWWLMNQPTPDEKAEQINQTVEQTVIPTLAETESQNASNPQSAESSDVTDPLLADAEDDSAALPPDVTSETASVGSDSDDNQRVVITSEVVDALLEDKPESVDTSAIDDVVEQSKVPETEAVTTVQEAAEQNTSVDEQPAEATPPIANTAIEFSFAREELKAFSARSYTLQLAAVNTLAEVQTFINRYELKDKVYVYPTIRNGVEWFIVTYQNYPTIQLARDAVETLPKSLQQLDPWAKSMNQVHREIDRAK